MITGMDPLFARDVADDDNSAEACPKHDNHLRLKRAGDVVLGSNVQGGFSKQGMTYPALYHRIEFRVAYALGSLTAVVGSALLRPFR